MKTVIDPVATACLKLFHTIDMFLVVCIWYLKCV